MYLKNGNHTNDFEMFLNNLADDKNNVTIRRGENKIIVDEEIFIIFNEPLKNKHFNFSDIVFNKTVTFQSHSEDGLEFNLENTYFEKLNILNCTIDHIVFSGEINHIEELNISKCKLKGVTINSNIQGDIKFQECTFEDFNKYNSGKNIRFAANFAFNFCEVGDIVKLTNFDFENKVSFKMSKFKNNVYFNNSHFKDHADFHECEFEKTACFYGVKFGKAPNLSQVIFKGNLNAVNVNLNFTFNELEDKIKQECEDFNESTKGQDKKSLDKFANDFRDSFRTFKSALIKDNNLLDASNFHKYELYCKEIELKQNWNKKGIKPQNQQNLEKNTWRVRELVDFLLLGFYRKLCDHHTDFLKVFNNFILLIVLYALFFLGFIWFHDDKLESIRAILNLFGFFDGFEFYFNIGVIICLVLGLILAFYKIDENFTKLFSKILKIFQCSPYIKEWLLKIFKKETFIKLFSGLKIIGTDLWFLIESLIVIFFIPCAFYGLFGFFLNLDKDFEYSLFINALFVSLYICLVCTKSLFFGRYVVLIFSYMGFFIILIKQPSIIHPLIGKIANEYGKFSNYPSLTTLNILYTILLALILFSLQKTARKNSIVPN
ncbi:hypothetical protein CQA38_06525 [Campylobacter sp. MIT 12-5580]|nr:hypothetical protein CQA38_06525 [Campylobacter sp. MIT 12-5580]